MSAHEQFGEDLSLYALGSLEGEERTVLERHLETCASCREELAALRGDLALLSTAIVGPKPPQRSRQRLMDAIAKEPHTAAVAVRDLRVDKAREVQPRSGWAWFGGLGWVAAAMMFVIAFQARNENGKLRNSVAALGSLVGQQTSELADAKRVFDTITAPEAQKVVLVAAKAPPQPQGKAFYMRDKSSLVFVANNLPPLAPEKIYELWLIPKTGPPIAAGLFKPDEHGSATVVNPPLPAGVEAKTFVVTLEPLTAPHDAPHGSAVMSGIGL
jgi:anti-sigma-K factor RskA